MRARRAIAWIAGLALLPVIAFAIFGYSGQDFEFHVTSWMAISNAWRAGHLMPMWDGRANFGLGDTHLGMYPPGSMYAGAALAWMLPLWVVPAVFVWLAVALSGLAMYWASREFVAGRDRLTAAVLYMLGPYLLTTAMVRFAAGELLVQMWLPLILLLYYRTVWLRRWSYVAPLAALLGLSWMTNIPEAIVLMYCLGSVAVVCGWRQRSGWPVARVLVAEAVGGALAAFYLAPLWVERAWINQAGLTRLDPVRLLILMPYHGVGPEPLKLFKYSCWLFACGYFLLLVVCLWRSARVDRERPATRTWTYLAALAFLFQLPIAWEVWRHLPEMALVAFAFRFLPLMGAAVPLVLLASGTTLRVRRWAYVLVAAMSLLPMVEYVRTQRTASTRMPEFAELEHRWLRFGYEGMPEFVPLGQRRPVGPGAGVTTSFPDAPFEASCVATVYPRGAEEVPVGVSATAPCEVRFGVFAYPYLRVVDETGMRLAAGADEDGILTVKVRAGQHLLRAEFVPRSWVRSMSVVVSWFVLVGLAGVVWWRRGDWADGAEGGDL